jgi:putative transposase
VSPGQFPLFQRFGRFSRRSSSATDAMTSSKMREAWPDDGALTFLIRDRDGIYGAMVHRTLQSMDVQEVITAPRSPWQNPFVERVIGSVRRECLDHVIIWNERGLRRHLQRYLTYYHAWRPHLSLDKDAPIPRPTQPPSAGRIMRVPEVGLHHHDERRAA